MDPGTKRGLLIAFLIAVITLTACVVRTAPTHRHRTQHVESHEKHKPHKGKHKKHKKHHKH
jgi:hypothetical protein